MRTRYSPALRITSAVTLAFFSWTFLSLWQIPAAIAAEKQKTLAGGRATTQPVSEKPKPEEKFDDVLDAIRENINRAGDKAVRGADDSVEREALKTKRTELESLDVALQKQFSVTEKLIKDKGLSKTISDRHAAFVKNYERNLSQLKSELDDIETAKTKADRTVKIEKTRLHLEKTKPKRHHKPLNPDQLPNRNRKSIKTVAPRLKREDFDRAFPKQYKSGKLTSLRTLLAANEHEWTRTNNKPIQLAFNGPVSGIPISFAQASTPQIAYSDITPLILAQATDQPSADDLAETPDIQFTDAIRAKAQELGNNPVKIYEYVRNNIEFAPTYGSIQGADQCLQSMICNDMDTASLLIALLRVSGIYSHYVYGTVDIPIDKAMNWVGGVTDPKMVGTIFATNGVPVTLLKTSGNVYKYARIEHVWASGFIDYIPSRGAVQKQGNKWIPLDPSYKTYNYVQGIDSRTAVPFDAQSFSNQILSTATTNTTDGSVTNVNSALVQQTMQDYQTQVQNYIQQNYPNATVGDVIGKKEIKTQVLGILPPTLPYSITQTGSEFAQIPDTLRETMSFSIPDATGGSTGLTYTIGMPQIAGRKITLSFSPATANDQAAIESLLPVPHADGTPIQPSEIPSSFPAYLINLVSELRIEGQVVATGAVGTMGSEQSFTMSLNEPSIGISNINNIIKAGEYYGIGVDTGRIGPERLNALKAKLETTKMQIESQNYTNLTKDDIIGDMVYTTITTYFGMLDLADEIAARTQGVIRYRVPSIGMYSTNLSVQQIFGLPSSASSKGMMMDVDRIMQAVFSKDGNAVRVKQYMISSGSVSSAFENIVPEQMYSSSSNAVKGISAVKALEIANSQGMPIYTIDQANVSSVLPLLQVGADVKNDIANAANAGKQVIVSESNINFNGWTGCGYIIMDSVTGAGAYMISGGMNGSLEGFESMVLGALCIFLGLFLLSTGILAPLAILLFFMGMTFFLTGLYYATQDYTYDDWQQFNCLFAAAFVGVGSLLAGAPWGAICTIIGLGYWFNNHTNVTNLPCQGGF